MSSRGKNEAYSGENLLNTGGNYNSIGGKSTLLNLDGFDKEFTITDGEEKLFDGRKIPLQSKDGVMLPMNLSLGQVEIAYSTAEITAVNEGSMDFRLTQVEDVIAFEQGMKILSSEDYAVEESQELTLVKSEKHAKVDDQLRVLLG